MTDTINDNDGPQEKTDPEDVRTRLLRTIDAQTSPVQPDVITHGSLFSTLNVGNVDTSVAAEQLEQAIEAGDVIHEIEDGRDAYRLDKKIDVPVRGRMED